MAKIKIKVGKPIRAGSTNKSHGGFPTQQIIKIMQAYNKKGNG